MTLGRNKSFLAPRLSRAEIIAAAENLTKEFARTFYDPLLDPKWIGINFDVVFDNLIYPKYEIQLIENEELGFDEVGEKILGKFVPEDNAVYIDACLRPELRDPRRVFTCWHEVGGHAILQGDWLRRIMRVGNHREIVTTESMISDQTVQVLERQANLYASRAAAPDWLLAQAILDAFDPHRPVHYTGPGRYCFVVQKHTVFRDVESHAHLCKVIARCIQHRFGGLSVEALSYRVAETPFIRGPKPKTFEVRRTARAPIQAFTSPWPSQEAVLAFR